ncbi:acyl transferase [Enterovibrio norvegicus]|uniref:RraA family protein n=2 Tax=Enterovibrio norvegicus TaxID=188144 RepID=UPI000C860765|nr:RraA family protein [Enterovibrio norvegicus]MCC4796851.1 RraA family protein [Enterovibrio norvegicus]PMI37576.1 acyl transferase [Enterovibrio norvegicus]PMN51390.1 acyl transferase [Enterovibrio norvegicus]
MDKTLYELLISVDTPTVCNAIEVAQGKRGFNDFTRGTLQASAPENPAIVGYAKTAMIAALEPSRLPADDVKKLRMDYYRYMSEAPFPSLAVIEDLDFPDAIGAFWGEINTNVHKGLGLSGVLTNGVMRDLGDLPEEFLVLAGSVGPSHGFVHIESIGEPVEVFGLRVSHGDLIHADRHGAVVIPTDIIPLLADAIETLLRNEQIILKAAREEGFNFDRFEEAWAEFERVRT